MIAVVAEEEGVAAVEVWQQHVLFISHLSIYSFSSFIHRWTQPEEGTLQSGLSQHQLQQCVTCLDSKIG